MTVMVIDGNSIINRAFYGIKALTAPDGTPTNAVYGFLSILHRLREEHSPDGVCVCFDMHAPTFRHERYEGYKAHRSGMPEDLALQMPLLKQVLDLMKIPRFELQGYEADDLLGTISRRCNEENITCLVVTGDKDSFQLIGGTTAVLHIKTHMGQTETRQWDTATFEKEYGFAPPYMVDLKALMGDASDDIPGVPGIGEKTAMALLHQYGTLDGVYQNLDAADMKAGTRKKLEEGRESAYLSYELATINREVPLEFSPEAVTMAEADKAGLYELFRRLGFSRFIEKWNLTPAEPDSAAPVPSAEENPVEEITVTDSAMLAELTALLQDAPFVSVLPMSELGGVLIGTEQANYTVTWNNLGADYAPFLRLLFSDKVKKACHSVKNLCRLLLSEGITPAGFLFDTELAGYLLSPTDNGYEVDRMTARYLPCAVSDIRAVYLLTPILREKLHESGMEALLTELELPLCLVLAQMERTGFLVDKKALYEFGESLTGDIDRLQNSIWAMAGEQFNISSPKQLGSILFEKLMLPSGKKTKTGWSTNVDVLERLLDKHPIVTEVLEYRELTKLKSTYADGLLKKLAVDGRIHTNFQMTVTATGRLSSTEPNLQNIPVRKSLGAGIRRMFIAPKGSVLVDADYSQIELRLLAHISGDEAMLAAFRNGEDIHAVTASQVFHTPLEKVTPQQRSSAKAVNFGIVYGISAFSLAQDIGVSVAEAKSYIDSYLETYSGVRSYMRRIVEQAKADGYVSTVYGRRRDLPELKSNNRNVRSFGERVALNMPIQGTAADIMKKAMLRADTALTAAGLHAKLLLQVHDELIVECPEEEAEAVAKLLTEAMEGAAELSIPLPAAAKCGKSWHDAK